MAATMINRINKQANYVCTDFRQSLTYTSLFIVRNRFWLSSCFKWLQKNLYLE